MRRYRTLAWLLGLVVAASFAMNTSITSQPPPNPPPPNPPPAGTLGSVVSFPALIKTLQAAKPALLKRQADLLAKRYDLSDRPTKNVQMSGGRKAVQQG